MTEPQQDGMVGRTIGGHRIVEKLGEGYDVVSGSLSTLQDQGVLLGTCLADDLGGTQWSDVRVPGGGQGYFYLVRADNACGPGTYGSDDASARASLDLDSPCP